MRVESWERQTRRPGGGSLLTLSPPDGLDDVELDHEHDGRDNDGGQRRLGYVEEVGREQVQRQDHQHAWGAGTRWGRECIAPGCCDRQSGIGLGCCRA